MKRFLLAALLGFLAHGAPAAPVITVVPSVGPNILSSPNGDAWISNSIAALSGGAVPAVGGPPPAAYTALANGAVIPTSSLVVTDFHSWLGTFNPAAPFNGEFGNRVHFGLQAVSAAGSREISLSMVETEIAGTGAGTQLNVAREFIGGNYGFDFIGVRRNANGTIAEILDNGQAGTELVDELYFFGYGQGFEILGLNSQAAFTAAIAAQSTSPFTLTGRFFIGNASGSGFVTVTPVQATAVPLPGSVWVFAAGAVVLAGVRRSVRRA